nr:MAG TPA: hypothetical protein [Caudoviricetes sp.]
MSAGFFQRIIGNHGFHLLPIDGVFFCEDIIIQKNSVNVFCKQFFEVGHFLSSKKLFPAVQRGGEFSLLVCGADLNNHPAVHLVRDGQRVGLNLHQAAVRVMLNIGTQQTVRLCADPLLGCLINVSTQAIAHQEVGRMVDEDDLVGIHQGLRGRMLRVGPVVQIVLIVAVDVHGRVVQVTVVGQTIGQLLHVDNAEAVVLGVQTATDIQIIQEQVQCLAAHDAHIHVGEAVLGNLAFPLAQVLHDLCLVSTPHCGAGQLLRVGKAEVDDLIHAFTNNGNLAGHDGLRAHPLFAAHNRVVQAVVFFDLLLRSALGRGHTAVQLFARQTVHELVCRGDVVGVNQGRLIAQGFIAAGGQNFAALAGMHEGSHAAVAFHQVKVDALCRRSLLFGKEAVAHKSVDWGCQSHNLCQIARIINTYRIRHILFLLPLLQENADVAECHFQRSGGDASFQRQAVSEELTRQIDHGFFISLEVLGGNTVQGGHTIALADGRHLASAAVQLDRRARFQVNASLLHRRGNANVSACQQVFRRVGKLFRGQIHTHGSSSLLLLANCTQGIQIDVRLLAAGVNAVHAVRTAVLGIVVQALGSVLRLLTGKLGNFFGVLGGIHGVLAVQGILHDLFHTRHGHVLNVLDAGTLTVDGIHGGILLDLVDHIRVRLHQVVLVFDSHCFFLLCSGLSRIICRIRKAAGLFAHAAFYKIRGLIKRQAHPDAVYEQHTVSVFDNCIRFFIVYFVDETVLLGFGGSPPVRFIHPLAALIRALAGFLGVQRDNIFPDGVQCFQTIAHILCRQIVTDAHAGRMDHVAAIRRCNYLVCMAGNNRRRTGAQTVDVDRHRCARPLQLVSDCLCSKHITATAVDVHRNFLHIAQSGKIIRKLFRRNFIAPPAAFRNIAVKQKFRFLAVGQIAELPETVIHFWGLRGSRLIHDSVRSLSGRFPHSQCRPPPFSFSLQ